MNLRQQIDHTLIAGDGYGPGSYRVKEDEIRAALLHRLCGANPGAMIVEEFTSYNISESRFDIALLGDAIHGYEIKSDDDNTSRIANRVKVYGSVCKTVTMVTGYKHAYEVIRLLPDWWGVELTYGRNGIAHFERFRECAINPNLKPGKLLILMWQEEAREVCREHSIKGYSSYPYGKLRTLFSPEQIDRFALDKMRQRLARRQTTFEDAHRRIEWIKQKRAR